LPFRQIFAITILVSAPPVSHASVTIGLWSYLDHPSLKNAMTSEVLAEAKSDITDGYPFALVTILVTLPIDSTHASSKAQASSTAKASQISRPRLRLRTDMYI
jgi:hypothetical protein